MKNKCWIWIAWQNSKKKENEKEKEKTDLESPKVAGDSYES